MSLGRETQILYIVVAILLLVLVPASWYRECGSAMFTLRFFCLAAGYVVFNCFASRLFSHIRIDGGRIKVCSLFSRYVCPSSEFLCVTCVFPFYFKCCLKNGKSFFFVQPSVFSPLLREYDEYAKALTRRIVRFLNGNRMSVSPDSSAFFVLRTDRCRRAGVRLFRRFLSFPCFRA